MPGDQTIASISGLLTSFEKNSREAFNSNEPTKIVDQLNVNSNYLKKLLYGLTLSKPLRQFHDLQQNIHQLKPTTLVLAIKPKNIYINSERIAGNPTLLTPSQIFMSHQILRQVSSSEFINASTVPYPWQIFVPGTRPAGGSRSSG